MGIRWEITAFLSAALLAVQAAACASHDIDLGKRGGAIVSPPDPSAPAGTDASGPMASAGTGGPTSTAGGSGATAGSSGQDAGQVGSSSAGGSGGAPAAGDSGASEIPDAGASGAPLQMSSGCGSEPVPSDMSIQVNGMQATYIVDLPPGYDKNRPYPLIMAFRGANVSAEMFRGYLNLGPVVGADAIVVNANCLNDSPVWDVGRDLPLFDQLLSKLEAEYCLDEHRVFAAGHGSGAFFTSSLGCLRGDKLRGIAPLSGGTPTETCQGELAIWISQGNADPAVATGRANRNFWADRNKCDVSMPMPVSPSPCVEFAGCDAGFAVRYCEYDGNLDLPDFAAAGLWSFFKDL